MLRDAGGTKAVMDVAQTFSCPECLQRGRRTITRPALVPKAYQKWECLSIDTFWWRTRKEALKPGENPKHISGLGMMDDATDFQTAVIIRMGNEPLRNISADEFQKALSRGWLQHFPAPSILRYDEEGFLRSWDKIAWLETFGMKLEPIAAESAWQGGKHSKHLQTLKEQLNLLRKEIGYSFGPEQLLALAVGAKLITCTIYVVILLTNGLLDKTIRESLLSWKTPTTCLIRLPETSLLLRNKCKPNIRPESCSCKLMRRRESPRHCTQKAGRCGNFAWRNLNTISERVPKKAVAMGVIGMAQHASSRTKRQEILKGVNIWVLLSG